MFRGLQRMLRLRLLVPILRSRHGPEFRARGVLVGLAVAMTPLVGVQMMIVAGVWGLQRIIAPKWRFSVVIAMAWTWVSNVFTVPPLYYLFLLTGQLMMGGPDESLTFDDFAAALERILSRDGGGLSALWQITADMVDLWGVPMFIGCLPWALLAGWLGYRWSFRLISQRKFNMEKRLRQVRSVARRRRRAEGADRRTPV